jgi:hypothetical protein
LADLAAFSVFVVMASIFGIEVGLALAASVLAGVVAKEGREGPAGEARNLDMCASLLGA